MMHSKIEPEPGVDEPDEQILCEDTETAAVLAAQRERALADPDDDDSDCGWCGGEVITPGQRWCCRGCAEMWRRAERQRLCAGVDLDV